jgi:hypothetical protein
MNDFGDAFCISRKVRRAGKPRSFLYGYFVIDDVLIVANDSEVRGEYLKAHPTVDFCFKSEAEATSVPDRGCGSLKGEAIYLRGPLTEYPEPKPWQGESYVGFRYYTEVP